MALSLSNIFRKILPSIILCIVMIFSGQVLAAWVTDVINGGANTQKLKENSILKTKWSDFFDATKKIIKAVIEAAQIALYGLAMIMLAYVWYVWVTSFWDEGKHKDGLYRATLILIGIFLINVAQLVYTIITGSKYMDENFKNKVTSISTRDPGWAYSEWQLNACNYFFCAQNFWWNGQTIAIIKFLEVTMIATAVVMYTIAWFQLLFRWKDEWFTKSTKMRLVYGTICIVIVWFIELLYRAIFFRGALNAPAVMLVILNAASFFVFVGWMIAFVYIIIWAYWYITSNGDEEKAKRGSRVLIYTAIATIILLIGYTFLVQLLELYI